MVVLLELKLHVSPSVSGFSDFTSSVCVHTYTSFVVVIQKSEQNWDHIQIIFSCVARKAIEL